MASRTGLADALEANVVALAKTGNRRAFEELVNRRQSWLRNLFRRLCHETTLADDLSQQVFLLAWRDLGKLQVNSAFHAWLKQLAINTWLRHLRSKQPAFEEFDTVTESNPDTRPDMLTQSMDLDNALATLPAAVRLCMVLAYSEGMSHGMIADCTGFPLGTVKSHITRGAAQLRNLLAAYNDPTV